MDQFGIVVLAAGKGERLRLNKAKPLAPIQGKKLVDYPLQASRLFLEQFKDRGNISVILGNSKDEVKSYIENSSNYSGIEFLVQEQQLGTGDAVKTYISKSKFINETDYTIVICADTPLITEIELSKMFKLMDQNNVNAVVASFRTDKPTGYGRIVKSGNEFGLTIVEEKDADLEIKTIQEVNSGLYIFKTSFLINHIGALNSNNKSNEFYLTDIFSNDHKVMNIHFSDKDIFLGVNNLEQLEKATKILRKKKIEMLRNNGVRFIDSDSVYIDDSVNIGAGSTVYPNIVIEGNTSIGENVIIDTGCVIRNSIINENVSLKSYSHLENAIVHENCVVGPFARLRPGSELNKDVKVGNFVEIKKSTLMEGAKVSHLSYVGDAEIGEGTNIGCGFITCNYDGVKKHKTIIGSNCFVGSDTQMIAPVEVGNDSFVASGSTINQSMPEGSFAISRGRQITKEGLAKKFLKSK
jgi:bifunctional UDP-N-acetylglucosamine pyrophosphorylase / glucosamine-1-phosphate N-acetyltransferase